MPLCLCRGHGYHLLLVAWLWLCPVLLLSQLWFLKSKGTTGPGKRCSCREAFHLGHCHLDELFGRLPICRWSVAGRSMLNEVECWRISISPSPPGGILHRSKAVFQEMWNVNVCDLLLCRMSFTMVGVHYVLLNLWKSVVCFMYVGFSCNRHTQHRVTCSSRDMDSFLEARCGESWYPIQEMLVSLGKKTLNQFTSFLRLFCTCVPHLFWKNAG